MAWRQGDPWRVVESLQTLNRQIRADYPRAVPPATPATSWGSIADDAHNSSSDHYPHYYDALGKVAVVCARDFPHAPKLDLDAHAIAEQLRQSRDSRIGYVISNGRITGPNHNWRWDRYTGSDPHDTHIHVSTVHSKLADDARAWQIGEGDMETVERAWLYNASSITASMARMQDEAPILNNDGKSGTPVKLGIVAAVKGLQATVADLAARPAPGTVEISDDQLERVLRKVLGSVDGATPPA